MMPLMEQASLMMSSAVDDVYGNGAFRPPPTSPSLAPSSHHHDSSINQLHHHTAGGGDSPPPPPMLSLSQPPPAYHDGSGDSSYAAGAVMMMSPVDDDVAFYCVEALRSLLTHTARVGSAYWEYVTANLPWHVVLRLAAASGDDDTVEAALAVILEGPTGTLGRSEFEPILLAVVKRSLRSSAFRMQALRIAGRYTVHFASVGVMRSVIEPHTRAMEMRVRKEALRVVYNLCRDGYSRQVAEAFSDLEHEVEALLGDFHQPHSHHPTNGGSSSSSAEAAMLHHASLLDEDTRDPAAASRQECLEMLEYIMDAILSAEDGYDRDVECD